MLGVTLSFKFMHASGISKGVAKACNAARGHTAPHITKASATDLLDPWRVLGHACVIWCSARAPLMQPLLRYACASAAVAAVRARLCSRWMLRYARAFAGGTFTVAALLSLPSLSLPYDCLRYLAGRLPCACRFAAPPAADKSRCRAPRTTAGRVPAVPRHAERAMRSRMWLALALSGAAAA